MTGGAVITSILRRTGVSADGIPEGLPFSHDAASLAQMTMLNLVTKFGDLDVALDPAGVGSYRQWEAGSISVNVLGVPVQVASLDDIIQSKKPQVAARTASSSQCCGLSS